MGCVVQEDEGSAFRPPDNALQPAPANGISAGECWAPTTWLGVYQKRDNWKMIHLE